MDGFNEKKWFVYLTDHHEGPFSLAEIQAKMAQSQVTVSNFVWAEGMGDWKPMTSIPEFESILSPSSPEPAKAEPSSPPVLEVVPSQLETMTPVTLEERTGSLDAADLQRAKTNSVLTSPSLVTNTAITTPIHGSGDAPVILDSSAQGKGEKVKKPPREKAPGSNARAVKLGIGLLIPAGLAAAYMQGFLDPVLQSPAMKASVQTVEDATQPYLLRLAEKFPSLGKWISPIPALDDVTPEEYENLKAAAMQRLDAGGPKLAIALSSADMLTPQFYISSNLPDGAGVDVYVEGISDTLLNQLSFTAKVQATIQKKLGKTAVVRFADGKPLPRGEYVIYATEAAEQSDAAKAALANVPASTAKTSSLLPHGLKLLVSKTYFLGGKKDTNSDSRLKEFHDKLRAKATAEIAEAKQFAMTLENQLGTSVAKFTQLRAGARKGKLSPAGRKSWNDFNKQWGSLNEQLRQSYAKWTPEALEKDYFYPALYLLTQQTGQTIEQVHQLHQTFFEGKADLKAFDIQLGTAMSGAQNALSTLKSKIDQIEKLAPTPNGMPRREGL
jgi:hypothetical protein